MSGRLSTTASPAMRPLPAAANSVNNTATDSKADTTFPPLSSAGPEQVETLTALVDQISAWIKEERSKRAQRPPNAGLPATPPVQPATHHLDGTHENTRPDLSASAIASDFDLDRLEHIIQANVAALSRQQTPRVTAADVRRKSSIRKLRRKQSSLFSSDTEGPHEGDFLVPSCDVVLDNSKTLAYAGGGPSDGSGGESSSDERSRAVSYRNEDAWASFKFEIVRLAHTLRLKGWRRVPMDHSDAISVQRLSGALTNAVYVVSPPDDLPRTEGTSSSSSFRRPPPKLLLRIYGPQVEHLIDRESELAVLRRLARKHIGPRLLGTFANGRFEEFFHAQPLSPEELRNPDTSRQIAKRMRELHDGMDLLESERDEGPFVWRNWDKWLARVEQIVQWMDEQVAALPTDGTTVSKPTGTRAWLRRGLILGVPWAQFHKVVGQYRTWLEEQYRRGDAGTLRDRLVFAHNDTQYGNILRLVPSGESPLLLPANTHKQLVVIDFEYASANPRGLEFANHFTEWCYNYHDKRKPYACVAARYPTAEEQDRFVRAYVRHRPQFNYDTPKLAPIDSNVAPSPSVGPKQQPSAAQRPQMTNKLSEFMLDARMPRSNSGNVPAHNTGGASTTPSSSANTAAAAGAAAGDSYATSEAARQAREDAEVTALLRETRLWRLANTAQWIAWGVVQAKIPGMPSFASDAAGNAVVAAAPMVETPGSIAEEDESRAEGEKEEDKTRAQLAERAEEFRVVARETAGKEAGPGPAAAATASAAAGDNTAVAKQAEEQQEEEFDYLGYVQHRSMFFWGDALQLGFVKKEDLPEEMLGKIKHVPL